ncbi:MAG: hypothetical protein FWC97_05505 [Treponema sp.]|nr:hypothetical protein [Treponema sp.]
MEFVRHIVNSNTLSPIFTLPPSFQNMEVEVIVLPVDKRKVSTKVINHSAFGRLKAYANPSLLSEEASAWEEAVTEKYALR